MTIRSHDPVRRRVMLQLGATLALGHTTAAPATTLSDIDATAALQQLQQRSGGRLGVQVIDGATNRRIGLHAEQRFAMCSTFKLPLAALVLREAETAGLRLDTVLHYTRDDLVPHTPVTGAHLADGGMRIVDLAEAAQVTSDNLAANLLIAALGGPGAVTARFRAIGDEMMRLDRIEPELNRVPPGDLRDTTTPDAMARTVLRLFSTPSPVLGAVSQQWLRQWMQATQTGAARLRAGLPSHWAVGDKTGTALPPGLAHQHHDVAVIWRAAAAPVVIAAYYEAPVADGPMRAADDAVLAEVGRIVAAWL